jgi:hypothetical protein
MQKLIDSHFDQYLKYLRDLAVIPSASNQYTGIKRALAYCREAFQQNLPAYKTYFDSAGNLISLPGRIDTDDNLVYLNAHIDTVGADPEEWEHPFSPFRLYEDSRELVARGVSDCKAGVAYELFLSCLAGIHNMGIRNLVFTVTAREEGAGQKSSMAIGQALGHTLPLSRKETYLIVLENNVRPGRPPILYVYDQEKTNYVIRVSGTVEQLQELTAKLKHWNPVCIYPVRKQDAAKWASHKQRGGHVCSVPKTKNLLTSLLMKAGPNYLLKAGEETAFGVVPSRIMVSAGIKPVKHGLVLSNRSFDTLDQVQDQLRGLKYRMPKDFLISQGLNVKQRLNRSKMISCIRSRKDLKVERTFNIGCSDATIIHSALDSKHKDRVIPLVMGPGTRSQRKRKPPRLTHGRNETFDKASGRMALGFITGVLAKMGCMGKKRG